ncbi:hypothetical protein EYF80_015309 [Liparis tanakae]|uniref:Uncharacterized protein n=1 Tax=Liparis tanakae TaxID=230148 RepID=A0A4Z2I8X7_9TELE|nr:hypothetical protein EYF80_015309 [Liparis tanakae]
MLTTMWSIALLIPFLLPQALTFLESPKFKRALRKQSKFDLTGTGALGHLGIAHIRGPSLPPSGAFATFAR